MRSSQESIATGDLFILAACSGLVAAVGELALLGVRKFALHETLRLSSNVVWMTPLNDLVCFFLIGAALVLLTAATRRESTLRVAVFLLACGCGVAPIVGLPVDSLAVRVAVALVVIGAAYVLLGRALRSASARRIGIFGCAFAAAYAIVLTLPRWYAAAQLLLAVGVAVRITTIADSSSRTMGVARRTLATLLALFVLAGAGLGAWHITNERRALAALPPAKPGARNVLLIIWDTVRASELSLYGFARPTSPSLERLAANGVTFDWAFAPAPWTLPSHASMFTGRFVFDLATSFTVPLDDEFPTIAERLSAGGFATAGFCANGFYCNVENGLNRGFGHYEDYVVSPSELLLATTFSRAAMASPRVRKVIGSYDIIARRSADDISASFLHWLDGKPNRPFFVFLNYFDAHQPYLPPEPWRSRFGPQASRQLWRANHHVLRFGEREDRLEMSEVESRAEKDAYDGGIAYLDNRLGLLLDSLKQRGLLENTAVIVTSDHGEQFGEHRGLFTHGHSLYEQEVHVPLVINAPGYREKAVRVTQPVSPRELASTVIDLAGLAPDARFPGHSLSRFWQADSALSKQDTVLSDLRPKRLTSIAVGNYHLIRGPGTLSKLFDLTVDPTELNDLAKTPAGAKIVAALDEANPGLLISRRTHQNAVP
ncbi:MAG: sulfatase [bacterium]